jgi:hypothetical protein
MDGWMNVFRIRFKYKDFFSKVWDLHHEDAVMSNLEMSLEVVIHSLMQLEARKT